MKFCNKCKVEKSSEEFYKNCGSVKGCKFCVACYARAWRKKNPEKATANWLRYKHGIEPQEYFTRLKKQKNKCLICLKRLKTPHIDHYHISGEIRGILCRECNLGLGNFKDSPLALRRAAEYLETERACAGNIDGY